MELRVLRYYLAVAREENITHAAEILHITQPTLSRQMAELEQELNTKLFVRSNRNVSLTEDGMLLRRRAEEIIALVDKAEQEFNNKEENITGAISIGCGVSAAVKEILPHLLKAYSESYPKVRFELHTGTAANIRDQLDKGLLDIGILMEPIEVEKYAYIRVPVKDFWGILMPENDPLAQKDRITPEDLCSLPLIANWRIDEQKAKEWFGENVTKLNVLCTYDMIDNAAIMVTAGLGYAFVIKGAADHFPHLAFRPLDPEISNTSVLAWKKHQPLNRAVQAFIALIRDTF